MSCNVPTVPPKSIKSLLAEFYRAHQLGENGGEDLKWAKVRMGWFHFYFPNTASRKRALFFHDVHHLATGYRADLRGEAEIGAWEIGSGCRDFWAAWILNFLGLTMGLFIAPRRTFAAFTRGRRSKNLYHPIIERTAIEESTVGEIRQVLNLEVDQPSARTGDYILFAAWCAPLLIIIGTIIGWIVWR